MTGLSLRALLGQVLARQQRAPGHASYEPALNEVAGGRGVLLAVVLGLALFWLPLAVLLLLLIF